MCSEALQKTCTIKPRNCIIVATVVLMRQALDVYERLMSSEDDDPAIAVYAACCLYALGQHADAAYMASIGPPSGLPACILMQCAHHLGDVDALTHAHSGAAGDLLARLTLASIHYKACQFQVVTRIKPGCVFDSIVWKRLNPTEYV